MDGRRVSFGLIGLLFKLNVLMKNIITSIIVLVFTLSFQTSKAQTMSFYDFKMTTLDGKEFDMAQLKGKKVMIVNTASECGLTPQYENLEELYKEFGGDSFVILGFPANNFGGQEPGSDTEIATFCSKNYGVTFQMFSKISVKGDDQHPFYQWLTHKEMNGVEDVEMVWNFQKFLIDENGNWVKSVHPTISPVSEEIIEWITSN